MKNDKSTKLIVSLALVLFALALLVFAAASWGLLKLSGFVGYLENGPMFVRILIGIGFVALFVGAVYALIRTAKLGRPLSPGEMNLLNQTNGGSTYISSDAVAEMVQRLLKKNRQVKHSVCTVIPVEDGIMIDSKLTVFQGGDLNALCAGIQNSVKSEIESATGIPVRNVSVAIVQTVDNGGAANIEKRVN